MIGHEEVDHESNEINAFRPQFDDLDTFGRFVTARAIGAQRDHAKPLVDDKQVDVPGFVKHKPSLHDASADLGEEAWSTA